MPRMQRAILHTPICLVAIAAMLVGAHALGQRLDARRLDLQRPLARPGMEQLTPQEFVSTVMLGGLRGVGTSMLWIRASSLMDEGRYDELAAVTGALSRMEPRQSTVWEFHSWNLAYNVAERFASPEDRFRWIRRALDFAIEGAEHNPRNPRLAYWAGWIAEQRIGADPYFVDRLADSRVTLGGGATLVGRIENDGVEGGRAGPIALRGVSAPIYLARHHVASVSGGGESVTVTLLDGTRIGGVLAEEHGGAAAASGTLALAQASIPAEAVASIDPGRDAYALAYHWYRQASQTLDETGAPIDTAPWIYHGQPRFVLYRQAEALMGRGQLDDAAQALDAYARELDTLMARYDAPETRRIHRVFLRNKHRELPQLAIRLDAARARRALAGGNLAAAAQHIANCRRRLDAFWPLLTEDAIYRPGLPLYRELLILKTETLPDLEKTLRSHEDEPCTTSAPPPSTPTNR